MFGFLEEDGYQLGDSDKLGSKGRFSKRIDKFRSRNSVDKSFWYSYRDSLKTFPDRMKKWKAQQDKIASGEHKGRNLRTPTILREPDVPKFRILHPVIEHHFWWLLHNNIAHTLIGLIPIKWFFEFHDWTSKKLNAD